MNLINQILCKLLKLHNYKAQFHVKGKWIRTYCKRPGCNYEDWRVRDAC